VPTSNFLEWKGYTKEDARANDEIPCVICFWFKLFVSVTLTLSKLINQVN